MKILAMSICRWTEKEKSGSSAAAAAANASASSWGSLWGADTTGSSSAKPEPVIISQAFEVSEFNMFQRSSVRQFLTAFTRIFVKRTSPGKRNAIEHEGYVVHVQMRQNGLAGCVITAGILGSGFSQFKAGNKKASQFFMRARVIAQASIRVFVDVRAWHGLAVCKATEPNASIRVAHAFVSV